ncbi:MAG: DUF3393 domain-containing protein [Gammaproteobacteria bacterium]|nr:DUF3393 domain-containing protein [Gammaproteobacteria bacterium]
MSIIDKRYWIKAFVFSLALVLSGCSTQQMIDVISSKSPEDTARKILQRKQASYKHNPLQFVRDAKSFKYQVKRLVESLRGNAGKQWGNKNVVLPGKKRYVKYTHNYKSRAIIDFDQGLITVETLDKSNRSLFNAITTTLLTPDDPRSVDLYSDKEIRLTGTPYLFGLVKDHHRKDVESPAEAEAFAHYLVNHQMQSKTVNTAKENKAVNYVSIRMVNNHDQVRAVRYKSTVNKNAKRFGISSSLIYAIIRTESNFNPYAVSSAPAYGLMQLVPTSGARDAYRMIKGHDRIVDKQYLFNASRNIELGTAYLNILDSRYLGRITDPLSREYCVIAAYNGGAGNVLNMFSRDRVTALNKINQLKPSDVYKKLRDQHPRLETRRYLTKVLGFRKNYIRI